MPIGSMYGHWWVEHHDLDTNEKGFKCVDCEVVDFQLRTEWDWDENLPVCTISRKVNVRGENCDS